jgi:hypothetical protein
MNTKPIWLSQCTTEVLAFERCLTRWLPHPNVQLVRGLRLHHQKPCPSPAPKCHLVTIPPKARDLILRHLRLLLDPDPNSFHRYATLHTCLPYRSRQARLSSESSAVTQIFTLHIFLNYSRPWNLEYRHASHSTLKVSPSSILRLPLYHFDNTTLYAQWLESAVRFSLLIFKFRSITIC